MYKYQIYIDGSKENCGEISKYFNDISICYSSQFQSNKEKLVAMMSSKLVLHVRGNEESTAKKLKIPILYVHSLIALMEEKRKTRKKNKNIDFSSEKIENIHELLETIKTDYKLEININHNQKTIVSMDVLLEEEGMKNIYFSNDRLIYLKVNLFYEMRINNESIQDVQSADICSNQFTKLCVNCSNNELMKPYYSFTNPFNTDSNSNTITKTLINSDDGHIYAIDCDSDQLIHYNENLERIERIFCFRP